jgi:hypothetical protein
MEYYLLREPGSVEAFSDEVNLREAEDTTLVETPRKPGKSERITK